MGKMHHNPRLYGKVTADLVMRVARITYYGCKRSTSEDKSCMLGPFLVGASMASENLRSLLWNRSALNIHVDMLKDPPRKRDDSFEMFHTHGDKWCSWQEVWLN